MEHRFSAAIEIIGVNPFVKVPDDILDALFSQSGKSKGAIPIKGTGGLSAGIGLDAR